MEYLEGYPTDWATEVLMAEFELMFQGEALHLDSVSITADLDVPMLSEWGLPRHSSSLSCISPLEFYFNTSSTILGTFEPVTSSKTKNKNPVNLSYPHFIATHLLPCGKLDAPIQNFTENHNVGAPPVDMTTAIHAFAHFTVVWTWEHLVLCDLQGMLLCAYCWTWLTMLRFSEMFDSNEIMCLTDLQSHTYVLPLKCTRQSLIHLCRASLWEEQPFWEIKSWQIQVFLDSHIPMCSSNRICTVLALQTLNVGGGVDSKLEGSSMRSYKWDVSAKVSNHCTWIRAGTLPWATGFPTLLNSELYSKSTTISKLFPKCSSWFNSQLYLFCDRLYM